MSEASGGCTPSYGHAAAAKERQAGWSCRSNATIDIDKLERLSAVHQAFPDYHEQQQQQQQLVERNVVDANNQQLYNNMAIQPGFTEASQPVNTSAGMAVPGFMQHEPYNLHGTHHTSMPVDTHSTSWDQMQTSLTSPYTANPSLQEPEAYRHMFSLNSASIGRELPEDYNQVAVPEDHFSIPTPPIRGGLHNGPGLAQPSVQSADELSSLPRKLPKDAFPPYFPAYPASYPLATEPHSSLPDTPSPHGTSLVPGGSLSTDYFLHPAGQSSRYRSQGDQKQYQYYQPQPPLPSFRLSGDGSAPTNAQRGLDTVSQRPLKYQGYTPPLNAHNLLPEEGAPTLELDLPVNQNAGTSNQVPEHQPSFGSENHHTLRETIPDATMKFGTTAHDQQALANNPHQTMSYQEHNLSAQTLPQFYYASRDPTYTLHQYQESSAFPSATAVLEGYAQPSPTWSISPLASPAHLLSPHSAPGPHRDYFGTLGSNPPSAVTMGSYETRYTARARQQSKHSSPPTSLSPASQKSEPLPGSAELYTSPGLYHTIPAEALDSMSSHDARRRSITSKTRDFAAGSRLASGGSTYVKKETRVVDGACASCGTKFAVINLRGHPRDFANQFDMVYYCLECAPDRLGVSRGSLEASLGLQQDDDSISSAVVARQEDKDSTREEPGQAAGSVQTAKKVLPRGPKKRIRATDMYSPTICDVCSRWIGHGAPIARESGADLAFNVEIVCTLCIDRYRRCSDCGGGGGARLGVGKWRCKELFSPGRKTCDLSHARQSSVTSMEYYTTRVHDILKDEVPQLVEKCQAVFESALYSSLAVPEVLERGTAMIATYDDVVSRIRDGWLEVKKLIEEDVEETDGYRRYIGLRWSAPRPRKITTRKPAKQVETLEDDQQRSEDTSKQVIRPSMNLSGFVTGEWDITGGTFYVTISVPYSTGEHNEGSAQLINLLQKRVLTERQDMVDELLRQGRTSQAASIPPILHAFTMLFFGPESKLIAYMESKRQMIPLQRYMEKYPDTDPKVFPPYRKAYIGSQQKAEDWLTLVRRVQPLMPIRMPLSRHLSYSGPQSA